MISESDTRMSALESSYTAGIERLSRKMVIASAAFVVMTLSMVPLVISFSIMFLSNDKLGKILDIIKAIK